ncbi:MAG TPA: hypothetical protein DEQ09_11645 [Bacteroidales bacterium]|nr:hypothetical protein [Bacteroidales bacterium]
MNTSKLVFRITLLAVIGFELVTNKSNAIDKEAGTAEEKYNLIYQQDFEDFRSVSDFVFADPERWSVKSTGKNSYLECSGSNKENIGLLVWRRLEDYNMEFDVMFSSGKKSSGEFQVIYNFREPDSYSDISLKDKNLDGRKWTKVRLERNTLQGEVRIYMGNNTEPEIISSDELKEKGWPGFTSLSGSFRIDNIKVWAPGKLEAWRPRCYPSKPTGKLQKQPDISDPSFVNIFDGKTLDGWKPLNGTAMYYVENGDLVGECNPKAKLNTYLSTEKDYDNFILAFEVKYEKLGNSGIQIRSREREKDGLVTGYQVEIDNSERRWTGGLYEERGREWFTPLVGDYHNDTRQAFRLMEWNLIVIKADGNHFQTWVNGIPVADYYDNDKEFAASQGFIGF